MIDFRAEQTGNAALDRIQAALRALVSATKDAVAILRRTTGVGVARIALRNENYTLTAAEAACQRQHFTGTLTAARTIVYPTAADATAYVRYVTNLTTGGFGLSITSASGGTVATVAASTTKAVEFSGSGAVTVT